MKFLFWGRDDIEVTKKDEHGNFTVTIHNLSAKAIANSEESFRHRNDYKHVAATAEVKPHTVEKPEPTHFSQLSQAEKDAVTAKVNVQLQKVRDNFHWSEKDLAPVLDNTKSFYQEVFADEIKPPAPAVKQENFSAKNTTHR